MNWSTAGSSVASTVLFLLITNVLLQLVEKILCIQRCEMKGFLKIHLCSPRRQYHSRLNYCTRNQGNISSNLNPYFLFLEQICQQLLQDVSFLEHQFVTNGYLTNSLKGLSEVEKLKVLINS